MVFIFENLLNEYAYVSIILQAAKPMTEVPAQPALINV